MVTKKPAKYFPHFLSKFHYRKELFFLPSHSEERSARTFNLFLREWFVYFLLPEAVDKSPIPEVDDNWPPPGGPRGGGERVEDPELRLLFFGTKCWGWGCCCCWWWWFPLPEWLLYEAISSSSSNSLSGLDVILLLWPMPLKAAAVMGRP